MAKNVVYYNLGNKMLGQAGPNSIARGQDTIYNLGYDL